MTTWTKSQFPRTDYHPQVQRHDGLQDTSGSHQRRRPGCGTRIDATEKAVLTLYPEAKESRHDPRSENGIPAYRRNPGLRRPRPGKRPPKGQVHGGRALVLSFAFALRRGLP